MISPVSSAPSMSLQELKAKVGAQIQAKAAQSQSVLGSAAQEATETLDVTQAEAAKGDQQAVKLLAKLQAAKSQLQPEPAKAPAQEGEHIDMFA